MPPTGEKSFEQDGWRAPPHQIIQAEALTLPHLDGLL